MLLLRLDGTRNLRPQPGEDAFIVVKTSEMEQPIQVRIDQHSGPASIAVSSDSIIHVEGVCASVPQAAAGRLRTVGEVSLSLAHLEQRFGKSVYFTWFPLFPRASAGAQSVIDLEQFDQGMKKIQREPLHPMVCISLCRADSPESVVLASNGQYDTNASPSEKAQRFPGLLKSHQQHARMLQALYRQYRTLSQGGNMENTGAFSGDPFRRGDSMSSNAPAAPVRAHDPMDAFEPEPQHLRGYAQPPQANARRPTDHVKNEEITRLTQEVESTKTEAQKRIAQAQDAIATLTQRNSQREEEHRAMKEETQLANQHAAVLEKENERLAKELENKRKVLPHNRDWEMQNLQDDIGRLETQIGSLHSVLEDLVKIRDDAQNPTSREEEEAAGAAIANFRNEKPGGATYVGEQDFGGNLLPPPDQLLDNYDLDNTSPFNIS